MKHIPLKNTKQSIKKDRSTMNGERNKNCYGKMYLREIFQKKENYKRMYPQRYKTGECKRKL